MQLAKTADDELISAVFLIAVQATDKLHDWVTQQILVDPPQALPELVTSLCTVHRNLQGEQILSSTPEPTAYAMLREKQKHNLHE